MSLQKKLMVYAHSNDSKNEVFYIGIGIGKRPWCMIRRNEIWHKYVRKYGKPSVEILGYYDSREAGAAIEKQLIAKYKRKKDGGTLCNILLEDNDPMSDLATKRRWLKAMRSEKMQQSRRQVYKKHREKILAGLNSPETRAKIAATLSSPAYRKKRSRLNRKIMKDPKYRYRLGEYNKGRDFSSETREKMSISAKKRGISKKCRKVNRKRMMSGGNPMASKESRRKLSASLRGRKCSKEHRIKNGVAHSKVVSRYTPDGILIATYPSARFAGKCFKCTAALVGMCCNGHIATAKGYIWRFDSDKKINPVINKKRH